MISVCRCRICLTLRYAFSRPVWRHDSQYTSVIHKQIGFSLLELLIVLLSMAVLAAISWPQYAHFVQRAKRAEAKTVLMENAHYMERFLTENQRYDVATNGSQPHLPVSVVPRASVGDAVVYQIGLSDLAAGTYTLIARPANSMKGDACGSYTLNQTGRRGNNDNLISTEECWSR